MGEARRFRLQPLGGEEAGRAAECCRHRMDRRPSAFTSIETTATDGEQSRCVQGLEDQLQRRVGGRVPLTPHAHGQGFRVVDEPVRPGGAAPRPSPESPKADVPAFAIGSGVRAKAPSPILTVSPRGAGCEGAVMLGIGQVPARRRVVQRHLNARSVVVVMAGATSSSARSRLRARSPPVPAQRRNHRRAVFGDHHHRRLLPLLRRQRTQHPDHDPDGANDDQRRADLKMLAKAGGRRLDPRIRQGFPPLQRGSEPICDPPPDGEAGGGDGDHDGV